MNAWRDELSDVLRAFAGAYIFGIPLLFTMEMWWIGEYISTFNLVALLIVALAVNFGLTRVAGFKTESTIRETFEETIEAIAIGIVAATLMLLILNQIRFDEDGLVILGKILVQAVPLSIGASVTNQVFGPRWQQKSKSGDQTSKPLSPLQALLSDIGATATGGLFLGVSIAPTEEVPMIAAGLDSWHLLSIVVFSVVISYVIVFASGFDQQPAAGIFQRPFTETMLSYVVSLSVAFLALYLFNQIALGDPFRLTAEQVLVLGLPTTIGGAAGRLVI